MKCPNSAFPIRIILFNKHESIVHVHRLVPIDCESGIYIYTPFFFSIIICLMISIFYSSIDPDIFYCNRSLHYFLSTHEVNILFSAIPKCVATIVVIFVSMYVLAIWRRTSNSVFPINLPVPEQQLSDR